MHTSKNLIFDAHLHIIDPRFPLVSNQGYIPEDFTWQDYTRHTEAYELCGGAIVSGSFQAFDQSYLLAALKQAGPTYVGVTQLPADVTNQQLMQLSNAGVRALRFNLKRGGSAELIHLDSMAQRVHEVVGWHVELYVDAQDLQAIYKSIIALPSVSIDHLGLSKNGFSTLLKLAEQGTHVKATGFGRVDFKIESALRDLYSANPKSLLFGTDLPSTRAPRPYTDLDYRIIIDTLGEEGAASVLYKNAVEFYAPYSM